MPFICSKSASGKWVIMMRMKNAKNFFLKTPIKFSRLTSRFSNNRYHPVQHRWKAHKGTDYAAPRGTITSTGTVIRTGYTAGNGNM
jgi:murein DD-endopeptidase MepM/ murein hydrolase activator NlpD